MFASYDSILNTAKAFAFKNEITLDQALTTIKIYTLGQLGDELATIDSTLENTIDVTLKGIEKSLDALYN